MNYNEQNTARIIITKDTPFENVLQSLEGMLWHICHNTKAPGLETEDLMQELREQVLISWRSWDPTVGVRFSTYAFPALKNRRNMIIRKIKSQSRGSGKVDFSLENEEFKDNSNSPITLAGILSDGKMDPQEGAELKEILSIIYQPND